MTQQSEPLRREALEPLPVPELESLRVSLDILASGVGALLPDGGELWLPGTSADREPLAPDHHEPVKTAYSLALHGIILAGESMVVVSRALLQPSDCQRIMGSRSGGA